MRTTEKLYYRDQYLKEARATIVELHSEAIELDRTIAFPEGGGQEADIGTIETPIGTLRFVWTKKLYGTPLDIEGFKGVKSGGIILHIIHADDLPILSQLKRNTSVTIHIDPERRERLTVSHTASHFLYTAILQQNSALKNKTIGCHIKENAARFDFITDEVFSPEDVANIQAQANKLISAGLPIENAHLNDYYDARIWKYGDIYIPCGGTHLDSPANVGPLRIKRKSMGKNKERLICEFADAQFDTTRYRIEG